MKHTYKIEGMTCNGCKASVEQSLININQVEDVQINLESGEASISMSTHIPLEQLQSALSEKYKISEEVQKTARATSEFETQEKSKIQQLKPLLLILLYITVSSNLMHYKNWTIGEVMLDFMGLFYIVFSFFKLLDLKGFPDSFRMYDPLAKRLPIYAWIYPFIETALGIAFLMRFQIPIALIATIIVLGITTIGVTQTLLSKKTIRCACLGTALKLPMTEATFIENAIMIVMAITMLTFSL
ncbi:heavy-metal-associated domain-containing protein [Crocinitomix algicola]|uniref:heavy-metal-associated domain-containing protein n=1 Tax=Crocinitomix algicola TaxID=1740263 RepID=UPI0008374033|nr:heavy metal-associated domain-containing protein [Crocinitomix algicola]